MPDRETLSIAGFPVLLETAAMLRRRILCAVDRGERVVLLFANTNFVVQCAPLRERMLREAGLLIANDGVGLDVGAWLVHRRRFVENLNGTDFVPPLLAQLRRRVYLVGARPGVAARAAERLRDDYRTKVVGASDGYEGVSEADRLALRINGSGAEVVLVALGNPLQEQWILANRPRLDAKLLIGVGALFDFLVGEVPRAPGWVRRARLEWLYRLSLEPRRLTRRYTVDVARFLALCIAGRRDAAVSSGR